MPVKKGLESSAGVADIDVLIGEIEFISQEKHCIHGWVGQCFFMFRRGMRGYHCVTVLLDVDGDRIDLMRAAVGIIY